MRRKQILHTGGLLVLCGAIILSTKFLLTSSTLQGSVLKPVPILGACSSNKEELYQLLYSDITTDEDVVDLWSKDYHERIETIVNEQLDPKKFEPQCDAEDFSEFLQPTEAMQEAVDSLNFFKNNPDTEKFSRLDVGIVLLELLRSYECALQERSYFLLEKLGTELTLEKLGGIMPAIGEPTPLLDIGETSTEYLDQQQKILRELAVARPALERTIRILNGRERTKVLKAEVECLQRASLDIRNATSLAAEANSCLPRIWNSRDALRDFNER